MRRGFYLILAWLITLTLSLTACGGGGAVPASPSQAESEVTVAHTGDPAAGQELFTKSCTTCHGPTGEGIPGLGKDMTSSDFIAGKTDDDLVEFIKVGRDPGDPLNTTGIAMPSKGGNPALSDEDLYDIVAYIRTIQE